MIGTYFNPFLPRGGFFFTHKNGYLVHLWLPIIEADFDDDD